jgi:Rps23 Pro-64 3,4-dihydroxylase Tpa1-like proline 4-hydroxylase
MKKILDKHFSHEEMLLLNKTYVNNEPFQHITIDNFVDNKVLKDALDKINEINYFDKHRHFDPHQKKKKISTIEEKLPQEFIDIIRFFNSQIFLNFLQKITGIKEKLISDPYLWGGGLHLISRGGFLKIHSDTNFHPDFKLDRRLNLLLYLNKEWDDEYGGNLELWNKDMSKCVKSIKPIFNRAVIFSTDDTSYHGHPDPLNCPENVKRKSLAFYYYSNGRSDVATDFGKGTFFKSRMSNKKDYFIVIKSLFESVTPPIITKFIYKYILRHLVK